MLIVDRFEELPVIAAIFLGALLIAIIGYLDYLTGYEISLAAFYILPILILSWGVGRWGGIGGGVACAASRTVADLLAGSSHSSVLPIVWNATTRLIMYLVIAILLVMIRQHSDRQKSLARIDHLTGAVNKRAFSEILDSEAARSRRYQRSFSLAYIDVDNFKSINDSFGHYLGDDLLRVVADVLRSNVRASDTVARLGGDEFALLLPETEEAGAKVAVGKLQRLLNQEMSSRSWPATVSIGCLTCSNVEAIEPILAYVDSLMYDAKAAGKNTVRYTTLPGKQRTASE